MAVFKFNPKGMREWIENSKATLSQGVRAVTLDVGGKVIKRTPVDTGRARANWNIETGSPDTSTKEDVDKNRSLRAADLPEIDGSKSIFITNNLDYIQPLEDGHSKQVPEGMVAPVIADWQGHVDRAVKK